jgi:hypothetical protein
MDAVIDRVTGDNQPEVRDMKHAGIGAVRVANLDHREIVSFERETAGRDRHRRHGRRRDHPGNILSQRNGRAARLPCICAMVPAVATTLAPNCSASNPAANQ